MIPLVPRNGHSLPDNDAPVQKVVESRGHNPIKSTLWNRQRRSVFLSDAYSFPLNLDREMSDHRIILLSCDEAATAFFVSVRKAWKVAKDVGRSLPQPGLAERTGGDRNGLEGSSPRHGWQRRTPPEGDLHAGAIKEFLEGQE